MSNIRKGVECFQGGRLVKLDLYEDGTPVTGAPAPAPANDTTGGDPLGEADKKDGPTKQELIAALKEKGIKFHATMSKADLSEILKGSGQESEPPAPAPANDSPKGVGDQDVI